MGPGLRGYFPVCLYLVCKIKGGTYSPRLCAVISCVRKDLNSRSGFSLNPVPVSHRGRDVCGFPTGMRRPDPCTTHYTPHTLHYARYTTLDTPLYSIIHDHTHAQYTQYSIHTDTTVVVMLGGEGGSGPARWSGNWFCPAAQGQIRYTTVQGQMRYTTAQGQIRTQQGQIRTLQGQICYTAGTNPPEKHLEDSSVLGEDFKRSN